MAMTSLATHPEKKLSFLRKDDHVHPAMLDATPELPHDILISIFRLLEIPGIVRAGSVCSSWRAAYNFLRDHGGYTQTPCLLYTSESAGDDGDSLACLYSLAENKVYKLTVPEPPIRTRYVIGSSHGWIITADERSELHLVNPITGDQIALPSVTTIEQVTPVYDGDGALHKYEYSWHTALRSNSPSPSIFPLGVLRTYLFVKAFLSSDPSTTGDYFVVLIHNPDSQLSIARAGDDKWTWLPPHDEYMDCLFEDGMLYALNSLGEIRAFDLSGPVVTQKLVFGKAKDVIGDNTYIARAPWGDLLQIWRSLTCRPSTSGEQPEEYMDENDEDVLESELGDDEDDLEQGSDFGEDWRAQVDLESGSEEDEDYSVPETYSASHVKNTSMIEVFKVDFSSNKLVAISSLADSVLFLGHNPSLCLNADAYPHLKPNHVYFTDDDSLYLFGGKTSRRDIGVFNLEYNNNEQIVSPEHWSNWPAPVWVIPNPRKMNSVSHD